MASFATLKRDSSSELRRSIDKLLQETEHKAEKVPRKAAKELLQPLQVRRAPEEAEDPLVPPPLHLLRPRGLELARALSARQRSCAIDKSFPPSHAGRTPSGVGV